MLSGEKMCQTGYLGKPAIIAPTPNAAHARSQARWLDGWFITSFMILRRQWRNVINSWRCMCHMSVVHMSVVVVCGSMPAPGEA